MGNKWRCAEDSFRFGNVQQRLLRAALREAASGGRCTTGGGGLARQAKTK